MGVIRLTPPQVPLEASRGVAASIYFRQSDAMFYKTIDCFQPNAYDSNVLYRICRDKLIHILLLG